MFTEGPVPWNDIYDSSEMVHTLCHVPILMCVGIHSFGLRHVTNSVLGYAGLSEIRSRKLQVRIGSAIHSTTGLSK